MGEDPDGFLLKKSHPVGIKATVKTTKVTKGIKNN
jgi:hypothetical protein